MKQSTQILIYKKHDPNTATKTIDMLKEFHWPVRQNLTNLVDIHNSRKCWELWTTNHTSMSDQRYKDWNFTALYMSKDCNFTVYEVKLELIQKAMRRSILNSIGVSVLELSLPFGVQLTMQVFWAFLNWRRDPENPMDFLRETDLGIDWIRGKEPLSMPLWELKVEKRNCDRAVEAAIDVVSSVLCAERVWETSVYLKGKNKGWGRWKLGGI